MEWFQNKTTQLIALVSIVGTLAGFGYTGATYVNRLENLESKIAKTKETDDGLGEIEKRFEGIETSVVYINKSIDENILPSLKTQLTSINDLKSQTQGLSVSVKELEKDITQIKEENKNPLSN